MSVFKSNSTREFLPRNQSGPGPGPGDYVIPDQFQLKRIPASKQCFDSTQERFKNVCTP